MFEFCGSLTDVAIPEGITSIGSRVFASSGLIRISFPESLTEIGDLAFLSCDNLSDIFLADGLISIGESAFLRCRSLVSITIPQSVTTLGERAFRNCSALTSVCFAGDAPNIGADVFEGTDDPTAYYVTGASGWGGGTFGGIPTAVWSIERKIESIKLRPGWVDLDWSPFGKGGGYAVQRSPDGQSWSPVSGFQNVSGTSASIPRPADTSKLLLRVLANGG